MATDLAIDRIRSARIRGRYNVGPCEDPDERPGSDTRPGDLAEAIDRQRQLAFVRRRIEEGRITARQAAIFEAEADDIPQTEIARRLGVAFSTVRNELARGRHAMRKSWTAYAAATFVALIGVLTGLLRDRDRATLGVTDAPEPELDHPIAPPEPSPEEMAASLRRQALHACDLRQWVECYVTFERAAAMDPVGDKSPWVQKAKREAMQNVDSKQ
jgi:hypothetical protein